MRDLRPYICTYEPCKDGDQQYDSFKQWYNHETDHHRVVRRCADHAEKTFQSLQSWREHIGTYHLETSSSPPLQTDEQNLGSTDGERACPICTEESVTSEHVGIHLQQLALFALPRSTGLEDDLDAEGDGSAATAEDFDEDRDVDMEVLSFSGREERPRDAIYGVDYNNVGNVLADLDAYQLASNKRSIHDDWTVLFNPNVPRLLDIELLRSISHTSPVICVSFSADGKHLALGCDKVAILYSVVTGAKVVEFGHGDCDIHDIKILIEDICFDPRGVLLATCANDKQIRVMFLYLSTLDYLDLT